MLTWSKRRRLYFRLGSEGCSPGTRSIDLVSQNRAIKHDTSGVFTRSSLANFSPLRLNRVCYRNKSPRLPRPPRHRIVSQRWQKEEILKRSRVYQRERKVSIQLFTHGWTIGRRRWMRLDSAAPPHSLLFPPSYHWTLVSHQINRCPIKWLTWN